MWHSILIRRALSVALIFVGWPQASIRADHFVYRDRANAKVEIDARLVATGQGVLVLELADGQFRLVPETVVEKRQPAEGPIPASADEVAAGLRDRFGAELFRSVKQDPFVLGVVLMAPLPKAGDSRATNFLRSAGKFLKNVEAAFVGFVKEARLPANPPTHPLVVLIFESDRDFDRYAAEATEGDGVAASRIAGFYSPLTNYLAIRMRECHTFDVPLHEAIHQQVYNRHVFQRLAPIPHWFDEGIATGFEANEGRINIGPTKISPRYARQSLAAREIGWQQMATDDAVFGSDVIAGEAYGHAWGLHWLMVTQYRTGYGKYVRMLSQKEAMQKDTPEQRLTEFHDAFGKDVKDLEKEFDQTLDNGLKRQKVSLNKEKTAGISKTQDGSGEVELTAVVRGNAAAPLEVQGRLTNISPLRTLAFHVTVETDGGTYAEWHVPSLDTLKSSPLSMQYANKVMRNVAAPGIGQRYQVRVRAVPTDSDEAKRWKKGDLPVPAVSRNRSGG
jgi:hypothetical protein